MFYYLHKSKLLFVTNFLVEIDDLLALQRNPYSNIYRYLL